MKWSKYQESIFNFAETSTGNAIVEAVAGSGKTTTIVEAMGRIAFEYPNAVFLAFNKSIATELQSRGVDARTFHSLCYRPVTQFIGVKQVNSNKTYSLCKHHLSDKEFNVYYSFIRQVISIAKQLNYDSGDLLILGQDLIDQYGIELRSETAEESKGLKLAAQIFDKGCCAKMVDFDDLLYYAARYKAVRLPKFDFIFVDEAQDSNAVQHEIIHKIMQPESRLIAVGDPRQAIYGFRGADSSALSNIANKFNCQSFPLTVSYRCPKSVVEFANSFVPGTEAFERAPEGQVKNLNKHWSPSDFQMDDMILCRTNAPLISLAYRLIAEGKTPRIMGRDIGEGLINIIKGCRVKSVPDLREEIKVWFHKEVGKLMARSDKEEPDTTPIEDKYDCIMAIIHANPQSNLVSQLIKSVEELFSGDGGEVLLSTIHKAKGLEAKNVYWINHDRETPWARLDWQIQQEKNLCYVAATRAQENLFLIRYE